MLKSISWNQVLHREVLPGHLPGELANMMFCLLKQKKNIVMTLILSVSFSRSFTWVGLAWSYSSLCWPLILFVVYWNNKNCCYDLKNSRIIPLNFPMERFCLLDAVTSYKFYIDGFCLVTFLIRITVVMISCLLKQQKLLLWPKNSRIIPLNLIHGTVLPARCGNIHYSQRF